ncbi:Clp1-domain-containing protein [Phellopilus nigrolimitatus]|nr:Clp1-domain-containing protein [Phellopilus nigrolimitatus]
MADAPEETREWSLGQRRNTASNSTQILLWRSRGHAEVFGLELGEGTTYLFGAECKAAVYTWQGCRPSTEYVSDETPMAAYMNLHLAFEQMRVRALSKTRNSPSLDEAAGVPEGPPRVLVLGPENAGKTTACKILANYAVRAGQSWAPMFVNVDPGEGGWTVPGTISACPINMPIPTQTPASPLGSTATSAPTALSSAALLPLVYWYGQSEVRQNPLLLDRLIRNLGENVNSRQDNDPIGKSSGIIIDTPSSFAAGISGAASDKKYALVKTGMFGSTISVVKIPKSGGVCATSSPYSSIRCCTSFRLNQVVELDLTYRERVHRYQIQNYMYGQHLLPPPGLAGATTSAGDDLADLGDSHLSPISTAISFDDLIIYRIIGESIAPSSALPIGAMRAVSEMQPVRIDPAQKGSGLLNAVLALLAPLNPDENERYDEEVLDLSVAAFLVVSALDMHNRKMTVLMPSPGLITGRTAVMGSFEWVDQ